MELLEVTAGDGIIVPLDWFAAADPRCAAVLMPALGIQARLYHPLAAALSAGGCATLVLEQRGHGRSALRARRSSRFGMAEFLDFDIPAALDWLDGRAPGLPVLLGGHSLGGNLSTLYAGQRPQHLAGLVHIATGAPFHRDFPARQATLILSLCALVSVFRIAPGYFPGELVGFAGRESLQLMRDWRDWVLTGRLDFGGRNGLQMAVAAYRGPVISISLADDDFSNANAVTRALAPLGNARVTRLELGPAEQGAYLGHFRWARQPSGVANAILDWIAREVAA